MATVEMRSQTSCRITVSCGYDRNGRQIRKTKTFKLPDRLTEKQRQKELEKQKVLFEREVQNGTYLDGNQITFREFAQTWMNDYAQKELAPITVTRYKALLDRINQSMGKLKLCKIQPPHINSFISNLSENGIRIDHKYILKEEYMSYFKEHRKMLSGSGVDPKTVSNILKGKSTDKKTACKIADISKLDVSATFTLKNNKDKLSSQTILHHFRLISAILNAAVQWNLLLNNPADRMKPPRLDKKEIQSLDDDNVNKMLALLKSEPLKYQTAVYISLFGGLRAGEVMGLKWSDIDFETGKLSITRARQYVDGKVIEKAPKNNSSNRELKLPDIALSKLRELRLEQKLERLQLGSQWQDSGYILIQWNGEPMFPNTAGRWFKKWISKMELPLITFHGLRHSSASLLIGFGTNIATVSKRLGHSRISTTSDIYTHAITKMDEEAASTLDNIFTKKQEFSTV